MSQLKLKLKTFWYVWNKSRDNLRCWEIKKEECFVLIYRNTRCKWPQQNFILKSFILTFAKRETGIFIYWSAANRKHALKSLNVTGDEGHTINLQGCIFHHHTEIKIKLIAWNTFLVFTLDILKVKPKLWFNCFSLYI